MTIVIIIMYSSVRIVQGEGGRGRERMKKSSIKA